MTNGRNGKWDYPHISIPTSKETEKFYEPPVNIVEKISYSVEENVYKAILETGINVDKEELIKALKYDRGQYEKGYSEGYSAGLKDGCAANRLSLVLVNGIGEARCGGCNHLVHRDDKFCWQCGSKLFWER